MAFRCGIECGGDVLGGRENMYHLSDDDLFRTAKAFAENNMSLTTTANTMFLHKNTVKYRLDEAKIRFGKNPYSFYELAELIGVKKS